MGGSMRKPVAVNNWESLTSEATRLQNSASDLLLKARINTSGLKSRMNIVKTQTIIIHRMLLNHSRQSESHQTWIHTWWNSMDSIFTEFQSYQKQSLTSINELEERLLD